MSDLDIQTAIDDIRLACTKRFGHDIKVTITSDIYPLLLSSQFSVKVSKYNRDGLVETEVYISAPTLWVLPKAIEEARL